MFPDVFVACDKNMKGESFIEAPQIIFEIVSAKYKPDIFVMCDDSTRKDEGS